jgi:hypothetical protein
VERREDEQRLPRNEGCVGLPFELLDECSDGVCLRCYADKRLIVAKSEMQNFLKMWFGGVFESHFLSTLGDASEDDWSMSTLRIACTLVRLKMLLDA